MWMPVMTICLVYHTVEAGLLGHQSVGNMGNSRLECVNYVQEIDAKQWSNRVHRE